MRGIFAVMTTLSGPAFLSVVEPDLQRVRARLRGLWSELPESLLSLVRCGAPEGGKMLRSSLLLLWGGTLGTVTERHIEAGAILELLHSATLLHDDVLDEGRLRRGAPTVNRRWGNHAAVLLGDLLLGKVLELSVACAPRVRILLGRVAQHTCDGEISQTSGAGHFTLTEREYLAIISRKTAKLFETACHIGAYLSRATTRECLAAARFGRRLGVAYQIMDDLLDIAGDDSALRKTLGTDLRSAKPTLPLIHALSVLRGPQKAALLMGLRARAADAGELLAVFRETGSLEYVLSRLHDYADGAMAALAGVRRTPMAGALADASRWILREAECAALTQNGLAR